MKSIQNILTISLLLISLSLTAQIGNTTYGNQAAPNITTGDFNTAIGDSTAYNLSTALYGTFIGKNAGFNLNNDYDNTIIGAFASSLSTSGIDNVIIGKFSGYHNNASDNTFVGNEAGRYNSTGSDNTFIGENAGIRNTTGHNNTYVGEKAGAGGIFNSSTATNDDPATGSDNTAIGALALYLQTTGARNTAVGNQAGFDVTSGHRNTMVGDSAGIDISVGHHNTLIGQGAAPSTEYADYNTCVGWFAGRDNNRTNGTDNANRNTYLGARTGYSNRNGEDNVGIGAFADFVSQNVYTFAYSRNTFIGANSKAFHTDGVVVGYAAEAKKEYALAIGSNAIADGANSIAIGYQTSSSADNEVVIGNSAITSIGGSVNWTATSDGRFKTDIQENVVGLEFIDRLRPVTYHYDVEKLHTEAGFSTDSIAHYIDEKNQIRYSGFIAQEVEEAAKKIDYDFSGVDAPQNEKDIYGLRYAEFTVPMVKAMQELHDKVKAQEMIIEQQQAELIAYQEMFAKLEGRLSKLETNSNINEMDTTMLAACK